MKKPVPVLLLLILPAILLILSFTYNFSKGESYLQGYYDPSYVYLISSLNIAQLNGSAVEHIDHPGTTVQAAGAIVIRLLHAISPKDGDLVKDVLSRPEYYRNGIYLFSNLMITASLFILGLVVYKKTHNIYTAFLLQLTPFYSSTIYFMLTNTVPELFFIFILLLFLAVTLSFVNERDLSSKDLLKYMIAFGIISGFGMATKISFFPIMIIPLILIRKFSLKILFVLITFIGFLIFVSPVISYEHSVRFINWVMNMITHSGKYGSGAENFMDTSDVMTNLKTIFINEPVFGFSYLLLAAVLACSFFSGHKDRIRKNKFYGLSAGIFIAMTVQIIIVLKHFAVYYMIPVLMLSVPALYISNSMISDMYPDYFDGRKNAYLYLTLIIFSYIQLISIIPEIPGYLNIQNESHKMIQNCNDNYSNSLVISSYGSSGKETALFYGIEYSGEQQRIQYDSVLRSMYPDHYFFNRWSKRPFHNDKNEELIKKKFNDSKTLIFRCENTEVLNDFLNSMKLLTNNQNITFRNVLSNSRGETIYEIKLQ